MLERGEWPMLLRHVRRLSDTCIQTRFHSAMDDPDLVHWARTSELNDVIGWVVDGELRATVEIGYRGTRAECALTVEAPYRSTRIGRRLFTKACKHAARQGAEVMAMVARRGSERSLRRMHGRAGWTTTLSYARSIILPNAGPEQPLWMLRNLRGE
ncbi:MAG: GNAT family N-acetyltransferase [Pseudomonadota bacterium]